MNNGYNCSFINVIASLLNEPADDIEGIDGVEGFGGRSRRLDIIVMATTARPSIPLHVCSTSRQMTSKESIAMRGDCFLKSIGRVCG